MKKLYILFFNFLWLLGFSQHPDLINTNWQVTKVIGEMFPDQVPPPLPYSQQTTFSTTPPKLNLSFFNAVSADLAYSGENMFTLNSKACTLADYSGDNGEVNQFFGLLCNFFHQDSNYYYTIENNGSEKILKIGNAIFQEIHFKSVNLSLNENEQTKFEVAPNPATDKITIDNLKPNSSLELIDNSGKLIKSFSNLKNSKTEINIKDLVSGIYYLKINGQSVQKIIKK